MMEIVGQDEYYTTEDTAALATYFPLYYTVFRSFYYYSNYYSLFSWPSTYYYCSALAMNASNFSNISNELGPAPSPAIGMETASYYSFQIPESYYTAPEPPAYYSAFLLSLEFCYYTTEPTD